MQKKHSNYQAIIQYTFPYLIISVNDESESWNTISNKNICIDSERQIWSDRFSSHHLQFH